MGDWPIQSDYKDALQHPGVALGPALRDGTLTYNSLGQPRAWSGPYASVYKLAGPRGTLALKLFNFPDDARANRYRAVARHFKTLGRKKPACLVGFQFHDEGVRVGGNWFPALAMDWVDAVPLGAWVRDRVKEGDAARILALADRWVGTVLDLQRVQVAHGDLHHDNVRVTADDGIVLIDYDTMCVRALAGYPAHECGKPAYQHPRRPGQPLSLGMDSFAAWVILISLHAIAADPGLWVRHVGGPDLEGLLFSARDMEEPASSRLWAELLGARDTRVRAWSAALFESLGKVFWKIPPFDPLAIRSGELPAASGAAAPPPAVPPPPRRRVFISHSSLDRERVERDIVRLLERHGIETWYAHDAIDTAARWEKAIREGLKTCDWFLVVLSPRAVASKWVQTEVHWAVEKRDGRVVTVMIDDCEPTDLHLMLGPLQYADFRAAPPPPDQQRRLLAVWGVPLSAGGTG